MPSLVSQVPPQHRRPALADRLLREPHRPARAVQRAELAGVEQAEHVGAAGQLQVGGRAVAASRGRDEPGAQGLAHRVEQRPEHRAGREARGLQRQRLQHLDGEQPPGGELGQHAGQQRRGLPHQGLVRRVVLGHVVPGRGGPVRALDHEAEEGLLLGREEHAERGIAAAGDLPGLGEEGDLDPLRHRAQALDPARPDQPFLPPAPLGQRDAPGCPLAPWPPWPPAPWTPRPPRSRR